MDINNAKFPIDYKDYAWELFADGYRGVYYLTLMLRELEDIDGFTLSKIIIKEEYCMNKVKESIDMLTKILDLTHEKLNSFNYDESKDLNLYSRNYEEGL